MHLLNLSIFIESDHAMDFLVTALNVTVRFWILMHSVFIIIFLILYLIFVFFLSYISIGLLMYCTFF